MSQPSESTIARRNGIVEEWLWLVGAIAKHVMKSLPPCFEFDDLRQAGCLGLMDAAVKFDETRGVPFRCYAALRIGGEIRESVRRRRWRDEMHLPMTAEVLEMPGATAEHTIKAIEHGERARIVAEAEQGLSDEERQVIDIYFRADGKLTGIGAALGVKQSRSSQLLQSAKRSMRRELAWRGLAVDTETGCTAEEMSDRAYRRRAGGRSESKAA